MFLLSIYASLLYNTNMRKEPAQIRFWRHVKKTRTCWVWKRHNRNRYPSIIWNGKLFACHRFSWIIHNGKIPSDKFVLHRCDNKKCIRPEHLFLGNHSDNMNDASIKGLIPHAEKHHSSKLTKTSVRYIRNHYKKGNGPELAKKFNVAPVQIYAVIHGISWKTIS